MQEIVININIPSFNHKFDGSDNHLGIEERCSSTLKFYGTSENRKKTSEYSET